MRLIGEAIQNSSQAISVLVFLLCMGVVLFSSALFHVERLSCPMREELTSQELREYAQECAEDYNRGVSPKYGLCCTEDSAPNDFPSIIAASWWSMATMTSVGYGEVYPRTTLGKCVGFVAMLVGMVLIALPVAIVGQKFQDIYELHDLEEAKVRAGTRLQSDSKVWSVMPASDVLHRLRHLPVKDPVLAASVAALTLRLEDVWEQREQLGRNRQFELDKQAEFGTKAAKLLEGMRVSASGLRPFTSSSREPTPRR
uniref:Ion transport domain-containing protein n=1 Tax=Alexandrium catenella TaxID=2925 RepID=A0A7S1WCC6_ALECA